MSINERMTSLIKSYNHCFGSSARNKPSTALGFSLLGIRRLSLSYFGIIGDIISTLLVGRSERREGGRAIFSGLDCTPLGSAPPLLPFSTFSKSVISLRFRRRRRRRLRDGEAANAFPPASGQARIPRLAWHAHADEVLQKELAVQSESWM